MGGMIAQTLAAQASGARALAGLDDVQHRRALGRTAGALDLPDLPAPCPTEREAFIEHADAAVREGRLARHPPGHRGIREIAALSFDRELDRTGAGRQLAAIIASGDRTAELRASARTLVIHGSVDPLVSPSGGRATARAIAGAELTMIEGMGHDLPRALWPRLIDALAAHAAEADRLAEQRRLALGQRAYT